MPEHPQPATKLDRWLAKVCVNCPACRQARKKQRGIAFQVVKTVEHKVCPFCRAYQRVTGRPSHKNQ